MKGKQLIGLVLFQVALPAAWAQTGSVSQVCSAIPTELYLSGMPAQIVEPSQIGQNVFALEPVDYGVENTGPTIAPENILTIPSDPLLTPPEKGGVGVPWSWSRCYMRFISGLDRKEGIAVSATTLAGVLVRSLCNA